MRSTSSACPLGRCRRSRMRARTVCEQTFLFAESPIAPASCSSVASSCAPEARRIEKLSRSTIESAIHFCGSPPRLSSLARHRDRHRFGGGRRLAPPRRHLGAAVRGGRGDWASRRVAGRPVTDPSLSRTLEESNGDSCAGRVPRQANLFAARDVGDAYDPSLNRSGRQFSPTLTRSPRRRCEDPLSDQQSRRRSAHRSHFAVVHRRSQLRYDGPLVR